MVDLDAVIDALIDESSRVPALLQYRSRIGAHQYRQLLALTARHLPSPTEVLDWGAGNGHFSYALWRMGHRVTAYGYERADWLAQATAAAPDRYRFIPGLENDVVGLPFANGTFGAVFSVGVLEHVRELGGDETGSLREIRRVLGPGGLFICYHLPNRHSFIERAAGLLPGKHVHAHRYTEYQIATLVESAGMALVRRRPYGLLPRNSARHLPAPLRRSRRMARLWDRADETLSARWPRHTQNHLFVARRLS